MTRVLAALAFVVSSSARAAMLLEAPVSAPRPVVSAPCGFAFAASLPTLTALEAVAAPSAAFLPSAPAAALAAAPTAAAAASPAAAPESASAQIAAFASAVRPGASATPAADLRSGFDGAAASPAAAPMLGDDEIVYRGWQLAQNSKSRRARFGALVVDRDGRIVGEGWNRQSTPEERRRIGVGLIIHAEQVAIAQALEATDGSLEGARVYAVGISADAALYARKIEPLFACRVCARTLARFRVAYMSSSARGFREIPWSRAVAVAAANAAHRWWQKGKGKPVDPNIQWLPISAVADRLGVAAP